MQLLKNSMHKFKEPWPKLLKYADWIYKWDVENEITICFPNILYQIHFVNEKNWLFHTLLSNCICKNIFKIETLKQYKTNRTCIEIGINGFNVIDIHTAF